MPIIRTVVLLVALAALSACAAVSRTDVTTFHGLPPAGTGETFTIEAAPGKDTASLEFQAYAQQVAERLVVYGWRPANGAAAYRVVLDYGVAAPEYFQRLEPIVPGPYPYPGGFYRWNYWYPGPVGYVPVTERYFARHLALQIYAAGGTGTQRVYEGRAINRGYKDEIAPVMPLLIRALFRDFPGANGRTITVEERLN